MNRRKVNFIDFKLLKLKIINSTLLLIKQDVEVIEFLETIYQIDSDETNYVTLKLIRKSMSMLIDYEKIDCELVVENHAYMSKGDSYFGYFTRIYIITL
jgi:hypothetical protein